MELIFLYVEFPRWRLDFKKKIYMEPCAAFIFTS